MTCRYHAVTCLVAGLSLLCAPALTHAADLAGEWTLNYPFEGEPWTFTQSRDDRFVAETPEFIFLVVYAKFAMTGRTSGSQFRGVTYFVINGAPLPGGIVRGTVIGDRMTGRVVDVFFGVYDLEGQRQ